MIEVKTESTITESPIVDINGVPMRRKSLTQEIAGPSITGARSIISAHPASGITPQRMASLLRSSENGDATSYFELAEQMEELDLHYLSVMGTRKRAVAQMPITVEPADDSAQAKADAAFVEGWLDRDTLDTEIFDILDAIGKGVSFVEIIWEKGDAWLPRELIWQMPNSFEFDRVDGRTPLLRGDAGELMPLEPYKFIAHIHKAKSGLPIRGGLARSIAWGWMFKNYAFKDWVSFLEAYGQPVRVGRFDQGASEGDIRKLMMAVAQVGTNSAAVFPRTMDIEFIDAKAGTAPNELWRSLAEYVDDQVSKAVLGQTSSADAKASGIGSGQSDLHGDVRDDIARSDAKLLAATLNRDLVRPMIMLNFGGRTKYPRIKIEKPDAIDVAAMVKSARELAEYGVEIDAEELREKAGLAGPKTAGAKLLIPPEKAAQMIEAENSPQEAQDVQSGGSVPKKASTAFLGLLKSENGAVEAPGKTMVNVASFSMPESSGARPNENRDAIDRVTDELIGEWDDIFAEMIAPLEAEITRIATASENPASAARDIQTMLALKLGNMESAAFTQMLQNAGFAAFVAGEVDVTNEQKAG